MTRWLSCFALVFAPLLHAQQASPLVPRGVRVRSVVDSLPGAVGGVAVDALGIIYAADFGNRVYRIWPDGRSEVFASGLYGASGNAIDSRGRLLQASFSGNDISRIARDGTVSLLATGLVGPVGIAVDSADNMVVCNCRGNTLSRVTPDGTVRTFAESNLFACPNGITRAPDGTYYVANFRDGRVLAVSPQGEVRPFAVVPGNGNGHVAIARGALYVTAFQSHRIFRVAMDGTVSLVAGTGAGGEHNGPADSATFTFPNGIATGPSGDRLYVNDYVNRTPPTVERPPVPQSSIRQVTLPAFSDILLAAWQAGGVDALRAAHAAWKRDPGLATFYTELDINALGYRMIAAGEVDAATTVLQLNAEDYPNSFNTWDSLAEAHMRAGRRELAIQNYRKSLELNPGNTNATAMLERLGAN